MLEGMGGTILVDPLHSRLQQLFHDPADGLDLFGRHALVALVVGVHQVQALAGEGGGARDALVLAMGAVAQAALVELA